MELLDDIHYAPGFSELIQQGMVTIDVVEQSLHVYSTSFMVMPKGQALIRALEIESRRASPGPPITLPG